MKYFKIISDVLPVPSYTVIIICFFLPFLTIRCGENELASMSGFEIAKGTDFKKKMSDSEFVKDYKEKLGGIGAAAMEQQSASEGDEKSKPMVLLMIPLLLAIVGLLISFFRFKGRSIVHIILSLLGFLCLLIFGLIFKNSAEMNSLNSMGSNLSDSPLGGAMLSIKLQNAYYFSCFLFVLILCFYAFEIYYKRNFGSNENNDNNKPDEPKTNGPNKSQSEKVEEAIRILENL